MVDFYAVNSRVWVIPISDLIAIIRTEDMLELVENALNKNSESGFIFNYISL